jgi:hypothetical protein
LAFDGVKVGEFTSKELQNGVNIATLDTPNQRQAKSFAKLADSLYEKYVSWRSNSSATAIDELEDTYEMLNSIRPVVSRVTLKLKAK